MRAARSASEVKTTARPSCSNSLVSAAERLKMAPLGARLPNSAMTPPLGSSGSSRAAMIERSIQWSRSPASRSPKVSPVTVMQSRCRSGASSRSNAPMPPAAKKSSM